MAAEIKFIHLAKAVLNNEAKRCTVVYAYTFLYLDIATKFIANNMSLNGENKVAYFIGCPTEEELSKKFPGYEINMQYKIPQNPIFKNDIS